MAQGRYLLDTNALVALLLGDVGLRAKLAGCEWAGLSVISQLEFLAFAGLTDADRALFTQLLSRLQHVDLSSRDMPLMDSIQDIRKAKLLKLPDAIIAASAYKNNATLLTQDQTLIRAMDAMGWAAQVF
jgi:tRNA(fMet)-specific endonuclease VapC